MMTDKEIRVFFGNHRPGLDVKDPICLKSDRNRLAKLLATLGLNRGAEIGVNRGRFSERLCKENSDIELYCIDPWSKNLDVRDMDKRHRQTVERLKPYNATVIKKTSMDAVVDFEDDFLDFVFVDGNHEFDYACMDIICWSNKVRSGGIVACHDYFQFYNAGVVDAVDAYTRTHRVSPWYTTFELQPTAWWFKP